MNVTKMFSESSLSSSVFVCIIHFNEYLVHFVSRLLVTTGAKLKLLEHFLARNAPADLGLLQMSGLLQTG